MTREAFRYYTDAGMSLEFITALEFARIWRQDDLVKLSSDHPPLAPIPANALAFLTEAGLPKRIVFDHPNLPSVLSFSRLFQGLHTILEEAAGELPLPQAWSIYWVIGEETFENGSALFCIQQDTGHIVRIDIERDQPIAFVNTSVIRLAATLLVATTWSQEINLLQGSWQDSTAQLETSINLADPEALRDSTNFWSVTLAAIRMEQPASFRVVHG